MGGDCANFVSQCMLAGGMHYRNEWYVNKNNNKNQSPKNVSQLDVSWSLADPSPWISAKQFNWFWTERLQTTVYKGSSIVQDPTKIYNQKIFRGDVVQILGKSWWGTPGDAKHTTGYGTYKHILYHTILPIKRIRTFCK